MENYPALIFININMFVSVLEELTRRQFTYRWWWLCAQWEGGIGGWGISDVSQDSLVHHCEEGTHHPNHNPWNGWASQLQRVTILLVCPSRHMLYMEEGLDLTNLIWAKMLIFSCFFFSLSYNMFVIFCNRKCIKDIITEKFQIKVATSKFKGLIINFIRNKQDVYEESQSTYLEG